MVTAIVTGALALAACGASDGGSNSASPAPAAAASPVTVSTAPSAGIGNILVDSSGRALYTPDQEADGTVVCIDTCAYSGGWLTCLDAISGRYLQVDALGRKREGFVDYEDEE